MKRLLAYLFIVLGLGLGLTLNANAFNVYEGLELAKYLQKHKKFVVCIKQLENKNLYKFHFVKKCENGIQLKKNKYKNLFKSTESDNLSYMKN